MLAAVSWDHNLVNALDAVHKDGGTPLIVGGAVRDILMGLRDHKDVDVEVHGMTHEGLVASLEAAGLEVDSVGASFGVVKAKGLGVDFSLPRSDSKVSQGHRGFSVQVDPFMGVLEAARRRDLTINSIAYDPKADEVHDPFGGLSDLGSRILRPTDESKFLDDPLRAVRVAQFLSRLPEFSASEKLEDLCAAARLEELPGERMFEEFRKLLAGRKPSRGLDFMRDTDMLRFFPELDALVGCEQEKEWHPEGDVWVHTLMAVDAARELCGDSLDMTVMWATLCHDLGKPPTTRREDGRIRARGHEVAGVGPTREFLGRMRAPHALVEAVCAIVAVHLAPATFCGKQPAGPGAYRRLALKLADAGTNIETLFLVSSADHFGRTTPDALAREYRSGHEFMEKARNLKVERRPEGDVVQGRHLISAGMRPSKEFGEILKRCRELQYEKGLSEASEIMRLAGVKEPNQE